MPAKKKKYLILQHGKSVRELFWKDVIEGSNLLCRLHVRPSVRKTHFEHPLGCPHVDFVQELVPPWVSFFQPVQRVLVISCNYGRLRFGVRGSSKEKYIEGRAYETRHVGGHHGGCSVIGVTAVRESGPRKHCSIGQSSGGQI